MPTAPNTIPASVQDLLGASPEDRIARLHRTHKDYAANAPSWQVLLDAFEGKGGFLDGSYLWPYQREEAKQFEQRQAMARYHNYLEAIVDIYVRFVFTQGVKRTSKHAEYDAWLQDVDGSGTDIDEFLKRASAQALATGQSGILVDKEMVEPVGPSRAEDEGRVVATIFTPTSVLDWRFVHNELASVKLREDAPEPPILGDDPTCAYQYLIWDKTGWARLNDRGELIDSALTEMGVVPFMMLRPKASQFSRMLGRAIVGNANVIKALYNRASEEDEVLRAQAFSVMTVSVDKDGSVDDVKAQLGTVVGTAKALIVKGTIDYKTPSQEVPSTIRENIGYLVREIYRIAHVRYQRDGLGVETAESIKLQFSDLNEMLQGFAQALRDTEAAMARAWFGWTTPGDAEAAKAAYEAAEITSAYPTDFFTSDLMLDLETWAEAIALDLGVTMARRIKKKAARRIDPDMDLATQETVDAEIDAMSEDEVTNQLPGQPEAQDEDADGNPLPPLKKPMAKAQPKKKAPSQTEDGDDDGA